MDSQQRDSKKGKQTNLNVVQEHTNNSHRNEEQTKLESTWAQRVTLASQVGPKSSQGDNCKGMHAHQAKASMTCSLPPMVLPQHGCSDETKETLV